VTDLPDELAGRSPEEVLAFLRTSDDDAIREAVHGIGTPVVLGLVFTGMAGRYGPKPGRGTDRLAFALDDDGTEHVHVVELDAAGARTVAPGSKPRATLSTTLVRFLRVAAGAEDPKKAFLLGRLRLSGDAFWAVRTLASMDRPTG